MTDEKENPTPEHDEAETAAAQAAEATEHEEVAEVATQEEDTEPSLEDFKPTMPGNINPEVLQNIVVNLSIEVGRAQIKIKDLMRLTQGSVVELDRIAGEPLDLLVNNSVVAQGEIVLVNDRYGVRLTRVVPSSERLKLI
ncbi:flagellar motor switch protein FliN [Limnohabitans sp. Jir61]|jgi:flagellar motor switch protein FliN/FliY|uniref:flagellar motor switch protein FliN n=1 Tax=Limnohabitans sp. Jir61 TaxID=1826168 RepID=UPI001E4C8492|nr:flagellar motor switch protein FliN [Limnohabitans sp. Jir61]